MLNFIKKFLENLFRSALEGIQVPAPEQTPNLPVQGIRMMMITRAKEINPDEWEIDLGSGKLYFDKYSWQSARNDGVKFLSMLEKVKDETYETLYRIISRPNIEAVYISSLWRPYSGVHTMGLAIDIGTIKFSSKRVYYFRKNNRQKDFIPNYEFKRWLWSTGLITQWIGPWETNGVLGHTPGWRKNKGYSAIDIQHRNHCHITVRGK